VSRRSTDRPWPASDAFQLARRACAEPATSGRRNNEEALYLSDPLRQQAQPRATQDHVTLTDNQEHAVRRRQVTAGVLAQCSVDLFISRLPAVVPADEGVDIGP